MSREQAAAPLRIQFEALGCRSAELQRQYIAENLARAHKMAELVGPHGRPLAIVGSGPSAATKLDELSRWPGDIWAINNAAAWLAERLVESTLVSVDPSDEPELNVTNVKSALLASNCPPSLLTRLGDASIRLFHLVEFHPLGISGGCTTASRLPLLAIRLGYTDVTYFGCEGSFKLSDEPEQVVISTKDGEYRSKPELLMQCEALVEVIRMFPGVFKEQSGGLLRAMLHDDRWHVKAVSSVLRAYLIDHNGDTPFEVAA